MDAYKKLALEFPGINKTIREYTSGNIANHLNQLEIAISNKDIESINYCLNEIELWYQSNISKIHSNEFVYNNDDHNRNKALISELKNAMLGYVFPREELPDAECDKTPIIFLSHSSADKKFGDAIEKFIVGLGVNNEQLIYTSHPLHKIPLDANIYDYLRENIYREIYMIILWSDKYLESPACLNEMGAAWVTQSDYTNIFVPTFSFGNPKFHECAVDTRKMGAVLNGDSHCKANMLELKNKIQGFFGLSNDEATVQFLLDEFIKDITEE
ncbi:MAG TPA: toll/interleukin-1 receptor domain-containing protein [Alphaproteobacteria bacterium]|nr:toll/interleukin-1 receptor domain-containing protein [Alphaproteobacteria bacterium]